MPRKLRIEYPGAMYHVMNRGDRREDIFVTFRALYVKFLHYFLAAGPLPLHANDPALGEHRQKPGKHCLLTPSAKFGRMGPQ